MATVFIPPPLRSLTEGQELVEAQGRNVRDVIDDLDARFPGFAERICDGEQLRPGLAVAVGTTVTSLGLLAKVDPDSEVHFLPAISGG